MSDRINEVQLRYLLGLKCKTWGEIAAILQVSRTCLREYAQKRGLDNHAMNPVTSRRLVPVLRGREHARALRPGEPTLPPLPSLQVPLPVIKG